MLKTIDLCFYQALSFHSFDTMNNSKSTRMIHRIFSNQNMLKAAKSSPWSITHVKQTEK